MGFGEGKKVIWFRNVTFLDFETSEKIVKSKNILLLVLISPIKNVINEGELHEKCEINAISTLININHDVEQEE